MFIFGLLSNSRAGRDMEQVLKNIGSSKTFSISRNAKNVFENDGIYDHGIDEIPIPAPTTMTISKKPEITRTVFEKQQERRHQNFSDFILNDRNFYNQRKILLQQEQLQKQSTSSTAPSTLNTKGLLQEDGDVGGGGSDSSVKEIDVSTWPQCKKTKHFFIKILCLDNEDMIKRLEKYYEKIEISRTKIRKRNRFWSALFPETLPSNSEYKRRRIFPDPACKENFRCLMLICLFAL